MRSIKIVNQVFKKHRTGSDALKRQRSAVLFIGLPLLICCICSDMDGSVNEQTGGQDFFFPETSKYTVVFETAGGRLEMNLDAAIACMLPAMIPVEYEKEALKAQAVLLRTALLQEYENSDRTEPYHIFFKEDSKTQNYFTFLEQKRIYGENYQEKLLKYRYAALETSGIYLKQIRSENSKGTDRLKNSEGSEEQERSQIHPFFSWFKVSAGSTREGVLCEKDYLYENYYSETVFTRKEFERLCKKLLFAEKDTQKVGEIHFLSIMGEKEVGMQSDSVGEPVNLSPYGRILYFRVAFSDGAKEEYSIDSDRFCEAFCLPSPCVEEIIETKKEFKITVKGVGHGCGMSQFGANELAKEGKDYVEILKIFFTNIAIDKFE